MRRLATLLVLVVGVLAVPGPGAADEAPTSTTLPAAPEIKQETTVKGAVPDLAGRWLALARLDLPGDRVRASALLWEVGRRDDHQNLAIYFANMPPLLQQTMDRKNEANQEWVPTADELALLAESWGTLPAKEAQVELIETTITGRDAFDDTLQNEPKTKDALWVVTQLTTFAPSAAPAVRQVQVYATLQASEGGYRGKFASTTVAVAPFPIPISFEGWFRLYPITMPARGLWARVLDAFSGCGRR